MDAMDADASDHRDMEGRDAGDGPAGGHRRDAHESAWNLLALAHQLINQGKPSLALQTVLAAMRAEGGEQAVFHTLNRARELYRNKMKANAAVEELASLFAECVIAEAQPVGSEPPQPHAAVPSTPLDAHDTSILAMTGRKQIMLDAFADGTSFVCLQCGGLVSNLRKEEHLAYWCSQTLAIRANEPGRGSSLH